MLKDVSRRNVVNTLAALSFFFGIGSCISFFTQGAVVATWFMVDYPRLFDIFFAINLEHFLLEYFPTAIVLMSTPALGLGAFTCGHIALMLRIGCTPSKVATYKFALVGNILGTLFLVLSVASLSFRLNLPSIFSIYGNIDTDGLPWERCVIDIPGMLEPFTFMQKPTHPFLAEYERKISFVSEHCGTVTVELPPNTGGKTYITLYVGEYENKQFLKLTDHQGVYYVDLHSGKELRNEEIDSTSRISWDLIGQIEDKEGKLNFVRRSLDSEQ